VADLDNHHTHRFEGRTALVTGGASGIGRAVSHRLASEGAQVVIADIDEAAGEQMSAEHPSFSFIATDVTDGDAVSSLIDQIVDRHGALDCVHANAGIETPPLLLHETPDDWFDRAIAVNTKGIFLTCKHAIHHMLERGDGGAIVCTSSILDPRSYPKIGVYSISKAAVGAIVRVIATEYATRGIRANAIQPGATMTPMVAREIADAPDPIAQRKLMEAMQAMKRIGDPSEIAALVAFLLSDDSSFMTGASIPVDGGALAGLPGTDVITAEEPGLTA
jgi:NAD(P)-dependent dehydrogenase (short-subunit alcohol dehydrogenase family)